MVARPDLHGYAYEYWFHVGLICVFLQVGLNDVIRTIGIVNMKVPEPLSPTSQFDWPHQCQVSRFTIHARSAILSGLKARARLSDPQSPQSLVRMGAGMGANGC